MHPGYDKLKTEILAGKIPNDASVKFNTCEIYEASTSTHRLHCTSVFHVICQKNDESLLDKDDLQSAFTACIVQAQLKHGATSIAFSLFPLQQLSKNYDCVIDAIIEAAESCPGSIEDVMFVSHKYEVVNLAFHKLQMKGMFMLYFVCN